MEEYRQNVKKLVHIDLDPNLIDAQQIGTKENIEKSKQEFESFWKKCSKLFRNIKFNHERSRNKSRIH